MVISDGIFRLARVKNRREVGGLAGLTPTPYQSGDSAREQGITQSGNPHARWMTTELAWSWLRFQPDSALSVWFRERFGSGGKRLRRIGVVAVARKLLIALWRFLDTGLTRGRRAQRRVSALPCGVPLRRGAGGGSPWNFRACPASRRVDGVASCGPSSSSKDA